MSDAKRALYLFLLLCFLSVAVASTVMSYWYFQTRTMFMDRMEEVVKIRKSFFESIYDAYHQSGDPQALQKTLHVLEDSFSFIINGEYSCDFIVRSGDNKFMLFSRKDYDHVSTDQIIPAKLNRNTPLSLALSGHSGKTIAKDHYGKKIIAAYDYLDIDGQRFAIVAKINYTTMLIPKVKAALSATFIALAIIIGGGVTFYKLSGKNIAKLRRMNEELKTMADIADCVSDYIAYLNPDLKYVTANQAFLTVMDISMLELRKKSLGDIMKNPVKRDILLPAAMNCLEGKSVNIRKWIKHRGKNVFVEIKFVPHYMDDNVRGLVLTITDRTSEEQAVEALISLTRELEERVKEEMDKRITNERIFFEQKKFADMGQMMNAIAHQWRQPINSIGLYVQLIYESFKDDTIDDDLLENFKEDSMKLVQHMSKTIDDFRSFFDPHTTEKKFEVIKAIVDTVSLVEAQLKNHNIEFTIACRCASNQFEACSSTGAPVCKFPETTVLGFSSEFRQVIMNLVQNAKDALDMKNHDKYIKIAVLSIEDTVNISVSDNGGGIPEPVIDKVFDPYFTTKAEGKGTGIGLYMSKMIIEEHMKGHITAENSEEGAVFSITLPKVEA